MIAILMCFASAEPDAANSKFKNQDVGAKESTTTFTYYPSPGAHFPVYYPGYQPYPGLQALPGQPWVQPWFASHHYYPWAFPLKAVPASNQRHNKWF